MGPSSGLRFACSIIDAPPVPRFHFVHRFLAGKPRVLVALVAVLAMVVFLVGGWAVWFSYELTAGLPDRQALKSIGDMAQATTILRRLRSSQPSPFSKNNGSKFRSRRSRRT